MPLHSLSSFLTCLSFQAAIAWAEQEVVAGLTITSPPCVQASHPQLLQPRDNSNICSYGSCAGTCLNQGAFCCNPAGTSFSPNWICDNGACITSVRGDTGVVDCYDFKSSPDNPSGTTQSCIDFKPTTTCFSTDRCYTCSSDEPYCHWQTWVASNSPTLRWFSCITNKEPDETFLAATITAASSSTSSSESSSTKSTTSASPTSTSSFPKSTSTTTSSSGVSITSSLPISTSTTASSSGASTTSPPAATTSSPILSTGAIVGIAVGGSAFLISLLALLIYCLRRRNGAADHQQDTRPQISHPSPIAELSTPVYYPNSLAGSGSQGTDDQYWRYHSHPNLVGVEDRYKTRMPIELPVQMPATEIVSD